MPKPVKGNRDVNAAQRAVLAIQLRAGKATYDEIARRCGYGNRAAAYKAVQRELNRTVVENVEMLRKEELDSLEELERKCWKRLEDEAYSKSMLFAVDRILQIKERRARLMGLDLRPEESAGNIVVVRETPAGYLAPVVEAANV